MSYATTRKMHGDFEVVIGRVKDALKNEGFGVLTEIDVTGTLKSKICKDFRPASLAPATRASPLRL